MMIVDKPKDETINYKLQSMSHRNDQSMSCLQMFLRTCNHKNVLWVWLVWLSRLAAEIVKDN